MARMAKHSPIGASNAYRWMACPGSVGMESKFPNISSPYALEGSAAHRLAEKCLISGKNTAEFLGKDLIMEDGSPYAITEEMVTGVQFYLDYVRGKQAEYGAAAISVELKLHLKWLHPKLFGTADAVIADPTLGRICVIDLKFGAGVAVSPEENPQAMFYAIGAIGDGEGPENYPEVEIVIVQPRAMGEAVKSWKTSGLQLEKWGENVLRPAAEKALSKNPPLCAGGHCKFCRAAGSCPEQMRSALMVAGETFKPVDLATGKLPDVALLAPEELGRILKLIPRFEAWVSDVRNRVETEIVSGHPIPGWKMVAGRGGNRKWVDPSKAQEALALEIPSDQLLTVPELKSPAQIEATAKKLGIPINLSGLVISPPGKPTLAPDDDKRPELTANKPEDVFKPQEVK